MLSALGKLFTLILNNPLYDYMVQKGILKAEQGGFSKMHMLFETCVREELNKLEIYVHATGGKRFKVEDNPFFFSLSGCTILPFTCLTTDTFMSWVLLWSARLKCSATGKPPP